MNKYSDRRRYDSKLRELLAFLFSVFYEFSHGMITVVLSICFLKWHAIVSIKSFVFVNGS